MKRSPKTELTRRVNRAFNLLNQGLAQNQVIKELSQEFGVSATQAYRYVQQARQNQELVPIPEPKEVFTVKLAPSLMEQIRRFSHLQGVSISATVTQALEDFLKQKEHGQEKRQQGG